MYGGLVLSGGAADEGYANNKGAFSFSQFVYRYRVLYVVGRRYLPVGPGRRGTYQMYGLYTKKIDMV